MQKAAHWSKRENDSVECFLCPHHCKISRAKRGRCRVRFNNSGVLYTENYNKVSAINLDPIEKKPLYHYYPGRKVLSLGTYGCNFQCSFCQNWQLAHENPPVKEFTKEDLIDIAVQTAQEDGSIGIAYTYSEPLMWFEFIMDTAPLMKEKEQKNILVTNGFIEEAPLKELLPFIDALNIDVKGFSEEFYRNTIKGAYEPVLKTAEISKAKGCHVEITTLLIPGLNDSRNQIEELTSWIAENLGNETPLHFSRYYPAFKMKLEPTPLQTMESAREIALQKLDYVYLGNVPGIRWSNTYCPECGEILLERYLYNTRVYLKENNRCGHCGKKVNIIS